MSDVPSGDRPSQRFVFPQTFEGLFVKGLGPRLTADLKGQLRLAGIDFDQKLAPAYPADVWGAACRIAVEHVYAELPREQAERSLGRDFLRGYTETFMGRAMAMALKILPPMKVLERMQRSFRTGNNYLETRFKPLDRTAAELWLNETHGMPGFTAGILQQGGEALLGLQDLVVDIASADAHEAVYRVSWK